MSSVIAFDPTRRRAYRFRAEPPAPEQETPQAREERRRRSIRRSVRAAVGRHIDALPPDGEFVLTIEPYEETRRSKQNALTHVWCGEIGEAFGLSPDDAFGMVKLDVLQPLKLADAKLHDEAEAEARAVEQFEGHDLLYFAANKLIRSSKLPMGFFARFLTAVQRRYAEEGLVLIARSDDDRHAIEGGRQDAAA